MEKHTMEAISIGPWGSEEGTPFSHRINNGNRIQNLVIQVEGGIKSLNIKNATETSDSKKNHQPSSVIKPQIEPANIIKTPDFSQGIGAYWKKRGDGCILQLVSGPTVIVCDHKNYVMVSKRRETWNGIEQEITEEVCVGCLYEIVAYVSVKGGSGHKFQMNATVAIEKMDGSKFYIHAGSILVKNMKWKKLQCCFQLSAKYKRVTFLIDNPPPNIDLCIGPVTILPVTRQSVQVNLDRDEYLTGIIGYFRKIQKGMPEVISSLTFLTNRTKHGPYGPEEGTMFSFKMTGGEVIGFHGTSGRHFNSIGCHIKPSGFSVNSEASSSWNTNPFVMKKFSGIF